MDFCCVDVKLRTSGQLVHLVVLGQKKVDSVTERRATSRRYEESLKLASRSAQASGIAAAASQRHSS
jgi:hypothetical protein